VAGIVIGPHGLGWVEPDAAIEVIAVVGLAFLLFLAGLEIDLSRLRGLVLRSAALGFAVSLALALAAGLALDAAGLAGAPVLVAIILVSTSLGIVVPVLKDADRASSRFGQLVIAAATIADFAAIVLLSLLFSREATSTTTKVLLLGGFVLLIAAVTAGLLRAERSSRISKVLLRLQDTTAQIRVRGAFLLLVGFAALAETLGLETILGAFAAGVIVGGIDRDELDTHPEFHTKLQAVGYGVFIPVFFVASGLAIDPGAVTESSAALLAIPAFLACMLIVRGLPALLLRGQASRNEIGAAALLQATSLPFIVAATEIGRELGMLGEAEAAALVFAGLLSVLIFPAAALTLLRPQERRARNASSSDSRSDGSSPESTPRSATTV
jgi:Kef-type K+ transport system membrane component KefB